MNTLCKLDCFDERGGRASEGGGERGKVNEKRNGDTDRPAGAAEGDRLGRVEEAVFASALHRQGQAALSARPARRATRAGDRSAELGDLDIVGITRRNVGPSLVCASNRRLFAIRTSSGKIGMDISGGRKCEDCATGKDAPCPGARAAQKRTAMCRTGRTSQTASCAKPCDARLLS
eukprot:scaffold314006_cov28-Tisochrysis_lutea.AAC.2